MDSRPITDLTSIIAVESHWHDGPRDPWRCRLAGRLADVLVWNKRVRYFLPVSDIEAGVIVPELVDRLDAADPELLQPEYYDATEVVELELDVVTRFFKTFSGWVRANRGSFSSWCSAHRQSWIRTGHRRRIRKGLMYPSSALRDIPEFTPTARSADVGESDVAYAFDIGLRYLLAYGPRAGESSCYYSHPLREGPRWPAEVQETPLPDSSAIDPTVVSVASFVEEMLKANRWSADDYIAFVMKAKAAAVDLGLMEVRPGHADEDTLAQFALRLQLPPTMKGWVRGSTTAAAALSVAGLVPVVGPSAAAASVIVALAGALWSGRLPRGFARRWLKPLLVWPRD